jgi:hypothetical protein
MAGIISRDALRAISLHGKRILLILFRTGVRMDNSVKKNLLLSFVALEVLFIAHSIHGSDTFVGYLFTYFIGNSGNEEAIRFALSDDGHTFKALNENKPF